MDDNVPHRLNVHAPTYKKIVSHLNHSTWKESNDNQILVSNDNAFDILPVEVMESLDSLDVASNGIPTATFDPTENKDIEMDDVEQHGNEGQQTIEESQLVKILHVYQNHENKPMKKRWTNKCVEDLKSVLQNAKTLTNLTVNELSIIVENTSLKQYKRSSWRKIDFVNTISKTIGDGTQIERIRTFFS